MIKNFKLLKNKYENLPSDTIANIYLQKRKEFKEFIDVLRPFSGTEWVDDQNIPIWARIIFMDEFLECPFCREEYEEKSKSLTKN